MAAYVGPIEWVQKHEEITRSQMLGRRRRGLHLPSISL
jgi:hypothetical protein